MTGALRILSFKQNDMVISDEGAEPQTFVGVAPGIVSDPLVFKTTF
jgi:hypothetical protein